MFFAKTKPNRTRAQRSRRSPARSRTSFGSRVGFPFLRLSPVVSQSPALTDGATSPFSANPNRIRTYEKLGANSFRICTCKTKYLNPVRMRSYKMRPRGVPSAPLPEYPPKRTSGLESHSCTNRLLNRLGLILLTRKVEGRIPFAHSACQTPLCDSSSQIHLSEGKRSFPYAWLQ